MANNVGPTPQRTESTVSEKDIERSEKDVERSSTAEKYEGPPSGLPALASQPLPSEDDEEIIVREEQLPEIPLRYRLVAFSMIIFFSTGSSWMSGVTGPLKSTFRKKLGITNAQYGTVSSAANLVNTLLPIIGGVGMDYWGATYAAIISSIFILVGAIVAASATNTDSYGTLIGGLIVMGFGSTVIEATQSKLYAHWFRGSSIAFVFAIDIAWNKIINIISKATAVPMSEANGFWGWALWIPAISCGANMVLILGYWWYERAIPKKYRPRLGKDARAVEGWSKRKFSFDTLWRLPKFFWIFCGSQLFQNGAVGVYGGNLADIQTQTRGTSKLAAGYNSSLQGIIPIVLTPCLGLFFDKIGWRMVFVSWTAALYIVVFALIGLTTVHPLAPILLASFAMSSNAVTLVASIPVLVGDDALLGTAFGIWKSFQNGNSITMDVAAGAIQDRSPTGSYDNVIYLLIAIKSVQIVLGGVYFYLDHIWLGGSLRLPEAKRVEKRKEALVQEIPYEGWKVSKKAGLVVGAELTGLIIVSWVVYIIYSLGK